MLGTMLWFNIEKGYGWVHTEDGERLYVTRSGFLPEHEPHARCKGREVSFQRRVRAGDARAVEVSFVPQEEQQRARLRTPRRGCSIW